MRFPAALFIALTVVAAATTAGAQLPSNGVVTIGTVDSVYSQTLGEQRKFLVYTPPSYADTTYLPQRYPVLYLLDGDAHFHSVTGLLQILGTGVNATWVLPEMIVVAIANTNRLRDMTPTRVTTGLDGKPSPAFAASGGMEKFLHFITGELAPRIESTHRTSPYRVLVGHSLGGITAIQALYTKPEAFDAYVAIDPSLWWDNQMLLRQARERLAKPGFAGRTLYVAQANTINPADTTPNIHYHAITQFNGIAGSLNRSGLRYGYRLYSDDDHGSVPLIAEYDALRFIFDWYRVRLSMVLERPEYLREHFADVSAKLGYTMPPPERVLDLLGGIMMAQDTAKAMAFRSLYAELHPKSARAHEALGSALAMRGDTTRAVEAYRRALALAPGRTVAREGMRKLNGGQ